MGFPTPPLLSSALIRRPSFVPSQSFLQFCVWQRWAAKGRLSGDGRQMGAVGQWGRRLQWVMQWDDMAKSVRDPRCELSLPFGFLWTLEPGRFLFSPRGGGGGASWGTGQPT